MLKELSDHKANTSTLRGMVLHSSGLGVSRCGLGLSVFKGMVTAGSGGEKRWCLKLLYGGSALEMYHCSALWIVASDGSLGLQLEWGVHRI